MADEKVELPERLSIAIDKNGLFWASHQFFGTPSGEGEYVRAKTCRACDKGLRLAPDGIHYDDERGGQTWGVCDKVVESTNTRQRAERAAAKWFEKTQAQSQAVLGAELLADIIAAEFEK